jgi:hypothetical protein
MTGPASTYTASDGTHWQFYDFRLEHAGERRVRVPTGSDWATHRAFKSGDGPVYCYRFKSPWDYHETDAKVLETQIRQAMGHDH